VVVALPPVLLSVLLAAAIEPSVVVLALVPATLVVGAFAWLDRTAAVPRVEQVRAFLWGASVAALVAALVNDTVAHFAGFRWALLVSAPLAEEVLKGLAVASAVRRGRLRGWYDGAVLAGVAAAGFALVENSAYFLEAWLLGELPRVFVLRGIATPFAHPLFAVFTGAFLGRFGTSALRGWLGLPAAVSLHAAWNGASLLGYPGGLLLFGFAVLLFGSTAAALIVARCRAASVYRRVAGVLAFRLGFDPVESALLADWSAVSRARRELPASRRPGFEDLRVAALSAARPVLAGREVPPAASAALVAARAAFSGRALAPPSP